MNYEKALSFYKNDKAMQPLRAEHFPLLLSFLHLVFKHPSRIVYLQTVLQSVMSNYLFLSYLYDVNEMQSSVIRLTKGIRYAS